jgi:hypothetical protein
MVLHENNKIVRIINEVMIFLLERNCKTFTTNVKIDKQQTNVTFVLPASSQAVCELLEEKIEPSRLVEAEEYGWELFGLDDTSYELEQVALLIDDIKTIKTDDNHYEVTFIRKHQ